MSEIIEVYNEAASEYARAFFNEETLQAERYYLEEFASYLPIKGRLLDVGCGPGIEAHFFLAKGIRYEGIDLSTKMIAIAKERNPGAILRVLDMRKMDYEEQSFEGIMSLESLIHFPKPEVEQIIRCFHILLKNKGALLLALQEGQGESRQPFPFSLKKRVLINLYSESELSHLLVGIGFRPMSISIRQPVSCEFPFNKLVVIAQKIKEKYPIL